MTTSMERPSDRRQGLLSSPLAPLPTPATILSDLHGGKLLLPKDGLHN